MWNFKKLKSHIFKISYKSTIENNFERNFELKSGHCIEVEFNCIT